MGESHTDDRAASSRPLQEGKGPIRLALVITELNIGGAEQCLASLATGIDRDRFDPVVYSLAPRPTGDHARLVEQLETAGVPVRFVGATSKWRILSSVKSLSERLAEQTPHLVQTFLYHANVVGTLAARRSGVKCIVTGIRVADPRRWRQRLERFVTRRVSKVVCVSELVADFARERMGYRVEQVTVIPNGIDLSLYPAASAADLRKLGLAEGRRAMVCIGRLDRQKGLDWLLNLAPRLLGELPQYDLLLVGDGPQRSELEAQSARLGIAERVHFAGWRPDVGEILRACDLLLLPSRWEGMPNVLLEAMASERPVVCARVEGVVDVLGHLARDESYPPLAADAFLAQTLTILQDQNLAISLGKRNYERIQTHFSRHAMIAAYERLYDSLVHVR